MCGWLMNLKTVVQETTRCRAVGMEPEPKLNGEHGLVIDREEEPGPLVGPAEVKGEGFALPVVRLYYV